MAAVSRRAREVPSTGRHRLPRWVRLNEGKQLSQLYRRLLPGFVREV